ELRPQGSRSVAECLGQTRVRRPGQRVPCGLVTKVDLISLAFVALTAFIGWKKGLLASALSVAGIVLGAWLGSRLAPALLQGGTRSPYTPLAALAGAAVGAILLETLRPLAGTSLRSRIRKPRVNTFDSF